jgi:Ca-activated chloride channel family protein
VVFGAIPLVLLGLFGAWRRRATLRALVGDAPWGPEVVRGVRLGLIVLGVLCCGVALTQPRAGFSVQERPVTASEIVVVLDLSRSMDAQDVQGSRLERAKRDVGDLVDELPGVRVGLVIFAGGAYPRVPMTVDYGALEQIVETLETRTMVAQGSALGAALDQAADMLGEPDGAAQAVVVVSDGEGWDDQLDAATARLAEAGVPVYTIAVGTRQGAPIPGLMGGFHRDRSGDVVVTQMDDAALRRVAERTGGAAVTSTAGAADTRAVASELHRVLKDGDTRMREQRVWNEVFQVPLAIGVALLALAGLVGEGWPKLGGLAMVVLLFSAPARADQVDVRTLLDQGSYPQALVEAERLLQDDPDNVGLHWARAEALYRDGRYHAAAQAYEDLAERASDPRIRTEARYNAGNAHYRSGRLDDALESWNQVLSVEPEHGPATHNVEQVTQERAQRMQPPAEPPPETEQSQDPQDSEDREGQEQEQDGEGGQDSGDPQEQEGEPGDQDQDGEQQGSEQDGEGEPGESGEPGQSQDAGESDDDPESQDQTDQGAQGAAEPGDDNPEGPPQEGELGGGPQDGLRDDADPSQADGQGVPTEPGEGEPGDLPPVDKGVGEMSEEEARRLAGSVEEGTPRVVYGGPQGGKDW